MLYISMSRTSTISSCSASKTVVSTSSGCCRSPANCSAYIRATRAGVSTSPSRSGSSPTASKISRTARSIRSWSTGPATGELTRLRLIERVLLSRRLIGHCHATL